MLSPNSIKALSSFIRSWNGCRCQIGEKIVKLIGDCGDRSEVVEVDGNDIVVRSGGVYQWHGKFCSCSSCSRRDAGR